MEKVLESKDTKKENVCNLDQWEQQITQEDGTVVIGKIWSCDCFINYEMTIGEYKGNSTKTKIKLQGDYLNKGEEVTIEMYGSIERDALSDLFGQISEQLKR